MNIELFLVGAALGAVTAAYAFLYNANRGIIKQLEGENDDK